MTAERPPEMGDDVTRAPTPPKAPPETVLALQKIALRHAPGGALTAQFARGELAVILGKPGSGKSALAGIIAGTRQAAGGEVIRRGRIAPELGPGWALGDTATLERDLGLRAAAYGLDTRAYCNAVANLIGGAGPMAAPFSRASTPVRQLIGCAASLLIPADAYVADGPLLPAEETYRARILPLYRARRAQATFIWIIGQVQQATFVPDQADRFYLLDGGRLEPCPDLLTLAERYQAVGGQVPPGVMKRLSAAAGQR
ncbi:MAG: ATP-binding cassette domain-containing protein [Pseudomonadota bacterium]